MKAKSILKDYFLLIITIIFLVASFRYPTPLDQQLFWQSIGLNIAPAVDLPTIFVWFFCIIFILWFADSFYINQKAFHSDYVFANGLNVNSSCAGSDLNTVGDWCFIQTEKAKNFPLGGHKLIGNPPTHTHRIGNHIVMEGRCVAGTPLAYLPNDIKSYGRAMRGGIFGINECSIGYLSDFELSRFKQYKKSDYTKIINELKEADKMSVASLIEITRDKNRALNTKVEFANNEHNSLSDFLKNVQDVSQAINKSQNRSIWDKLFGSN